MNEPKERKSLQTAIEELDGFIDDFENGLNSDIPISADFDKIYICGMGASAIGGDIIADMLVQLSTVPITAIRSMDLPKWVNDRSFVISCSYSGNTKEALSMYDQAKARNCPMAVITSGGKLKERCVADNVTLFPMKEGMQPRNSVGLMVGYMINIIEKIGAAKCKEETLEILPNLRKFMKEVNLSNPNGYAREIAKELFGSVPAIYSTTGITSSTLRWQAQINENSKMLAFSGSVLEFNHNEIVGWIESDLKTICRPVFLYECGPEQPMADASIEILKKYGVKLLVVKIEGKTVTERCLKSIILGDQVSLCLAEMKDINPLEIRSIDRFKEKAAELFATKKK